MWKIKGNLLPLILVFAWMLFLPLGIDAAPASPAGEIPLPLDAYNDPPDASLLQTLKSRATEDPFNLVASLIFLCAVIHTFLVAKFKHWAHVVEKEHQRKLAEQQKTDPVHVDFHNPVVSARAQILRYLGEVEAVFGTWVIVLIGAITYFKGWDSVLYYVGKKVDFTEPIFVVVIMAVASTRPILHFATKCLGLVSRIGGHSVSAWWLTILIIAPLLGSFITEPGAMTIAALLLAREFYHLKPSPVLCHATLGLLFVNVSVGGTLTHFAAPAVLIVSAKWGWDTPYMFTHFGWKAFLGILISTLLYYFIFKKELRLLQKKREDSAEQSEHHDERPIPIPVTIIQLCFLGTVVYFSHYPALCIGTFLFFIAYVTTTAHHQSPPNLKPPLLVGFFLAGLIIHGGLQGWWIEPILSGLGEHALFTCATILTAFNDNASITYLSSLVPNFSEGLKYAVVAGAVTGGGLTVIANAPNPAGQNILKRYFPRGISPAYLLFAALPPTLVMAGCFMLL